MSHYNIISLAVSVIGAGFSIVFSFITNDIRRSHPKKIAFGFWTGLAVTGIGLYMLVVGSLPIAWGSTMGPKISMAIGAILLAGGFIWQITTGNAQSPQESNQPHVPAQGDCSANARDIQNFSPNCDNNYNEQQPRKLSNHQTEILRSYLKGKNVKILFFVPGNVDGETNRYAESMYGAIAPVAIINNTVSVQIPNQRIIGIEIWNNSSGKSFEDLKNGLSKALIPFSGKDGILPIPVSMWGEVKGQVVLAIGDQEP